MEALITAMKAEAIPLGVQLIVQEADLDKQFANRTINPGKLGGLHGCNRTHARSAAAGTSQVPPVHRRGTDARSGPAVRRTSRLQQSHASARTSRVTCPWTGA